MNKRERERERTRRGHETTIDGPLLLTLFFCFWGSDLTLDSKLDESNEILLDYNFFWSKGGGGDPIYVEGKGRDMGDQLRNRTWSLFSSECTVAKAHCRLPTEPSLCMLVRL